MATPLNLLRTEDVKIEDHDASRRLIISLEANIEPIPKAMMTHRSKWSKPAQRSLKYQETLAWLLKKQNPDIQQTHKPLSLRAIFGRSNHRRCDLKNCIAAVEDALQFSGLIHDDSQIVEYKECRLERDMTAPFIKMEVREL